MTKYDLSKNGNCLICKTDMVYENFCEDHLKFGNKWLLSMHSRFRNINKPYDLIRPIGDFYEFKGLSRVTLEKYTCKKCIDKLEREIKEEEDERSMAYRRRNDEELYLRDMDRMYNKLSSSIGLRFRSLTFFLQIHG